MKHVRNLLAALVVAAMLAGGGWSLAGCSTKAGDAVVSFFTNDEDVETKAKRSLAALYAAHAFAEDTVTSLNDARVIALKDAKSAGEGLDTALRELKRIELAVRSGILTNVKADLDSVEQLIGSVLQVLPEVKR